MLLFLVLAVIILVFYCLLIYAYSKGFQNYPNYSTPDSQAKNIAATILIPCRNPTTQLDKLLGQLDYQLLETTSVEIIIIDDFSEREITLNLSPKSRVLCLKDNQPQLSQFKNNKKEAIALGVAFARYDYILCLDSDITLSDKWWSMVSNFIHDNKPQFAAGLHRYIPRVSWLNRFLVLEQDILTASSIAALQLRIPTMCNGANMLFTKKAFTEVNGYEGLYHTQGGDDLFLYHRIYRKFPYQTFYIKNLEGCAYSEASQTLHELSNQRSRWMSKSSAYENNWIKVQGSLILLTNLIVLFSYIFWPLLPLFLMKLMADSYFTWQINAFYKNKNSFWFILFSALVYPIYVGWVAIRTVFYVKS